MSSASAVSTSSDLSSFIRDLPDAPSSEPQAMCCRASSPLCNISGTTRKHDRNVNSHYYDDLIMAAAAEHLAASATARASPPSAPCRRGRSPPSSFHCPPAARICDPEVFVPLHQFQHQEESKNEQDQADSHDAFGRKMVRVDTTTLAAPTPPHSLSIPRSSAALTPSIVGKMMQHQGGAPPPRHSVALRPPMMPAKPVDVEVVDRPLLGSSPP